MNFKYINFLFDFLRLNCVEKNVEKKYTRFYHILYKKNLISNDINANQKFLFSKILL